VPYFTTMAGAEAAAEGIDYLNQRDFDVKALQDLCRNAVALEQRNGSTFHVQSSSTTTYPLVFDEVFDPLNLKH